MANLCQFGRLNNITLTTMEAKDYLKSRGLKSVDYVGSSTNLKEVDLIELIENYADHKTEHLHQRVKELEEVMDYASKVSMAISNGDIETLHTYQMKLKELLTKDKE